MQIYFSFCLHSSYVGKVFCRQQTNMSTLNAVIQSLVSREVTVNNMFYVHHQHENISQRLPTYRTQNADYSIRNVNIIGLVLSLLIMLVVLAWMQRTKYMRTTTMKSSRTIDISQVMTPIILKQWQFTVQVVVCCAWLYQHIPENNNNYLIQMYTNRVISIPLCLCPSVSR